VIAPDENTEQNELADARTRWAKPMLERAGSVRELVRAGGGKISAIGGDPGENRKQSMSG
jgi:hypothetical protein